MGVGKKLGFVARISTLGGMWSYISRGLVFTETNKHGVSELFGGHQRRKVENIAV
jgi:hypothetical protein